MYYLKRLFILLVVNLSYVNAAEVNFGLDDEVVSDPFSDAVDSCILFSEQRNLDNCATATLEDTPPLGACKTSDIERLALMRHESNAHHDFEALHLIKNAMNGDSLVNDNKNRQRLLSEVPEFLRLLKLNENQEILAVIFDVQSSDPNLSDEEREGLYKNLVGESREIRLEKEKIVDRAILAVYSYCISGLREACYFVEEIYDTYGWLLGPETIPAYCEVQGNKAIIDSSYAKEKLSLAQLLNKPAIFNENGPVKLYAQNRMYSAYLDDNESSDVYMKLSEELLKIYKDTNPKNTSKLKETALTLTTSTNGYFREYYPEYFSVSERACDEWGIHQSCYELARAYRFGLNTPENHYLAEEYYLKAIELMPDYAKAFSELANMQLDIKSPAFNADKAVANLKACIDSIYCPSTLGFVYVSKLYEDEDLSIDERIAMAEELWLSRLYNITAVRSAHETVDDLLSWKPQYNFAYTSPSHLDEAVFKAALAGHKKAQLLLAQGFASSIPSNLVYSPKHAMKWILLTEQDFANGLSEQDRESLYELKNAVLGKLSSVDLKHAHFMATKISRYALENFKLDPN